jgi:hypothetical protein
VSELTEKKYVATYRAAEVREWRLRDGRSQAAGAGNGEMESTYNALYPTSTPYARARRSFPFPPEMLVLVKDAITGLAGVTAYSDGHMEAMH